MPCIAAIAASRIREYLEALQREDELQAIREHEYMAEAWQAQQRTAEERQVESRKLREAEYEARRAQQWLSDFPTLVEATRK